MAAGGPLVFVTTTGGDHVEGRVAASAPSSVSLSLRDNVTRQAKWKISANNRRARFYTLTTVGKAQLGVEQSRLSQMLGAIMLVMKTT